MPAQISSIRLTSDRLYRGGFLIGALGEHLAAQRLGAHLHLGVA